MINLQGAIEKSPTLLSQYWKNEWVDGNIIISYFGGSNNIFADCKWTLHYQGQVDQVDTHCLQPFCCQLCHRVHLVQQELTVLILLLPPKYEIIMLPSNYSFFQYCDSNIGLFSIAPCKVITLNPFCILFGISSLLLFWWLSL